MDTGLLTGRKKWFPHNTTDMGSCLNASSFFSQWASINSAVHQALREAQVVRSQLMAANANVLRSTDNLNITFTFDAISAKADNAGQLHHLQHDFLEQYLTPPPPANFANHAQRLRWARISQMPQLRLQRYSPRMPIRAPIRAALQSYIIITPYSTFD